MLTLIISITERADLFRLLELKTCERTEKMCSEMKDLSLTIEKRVPQCALSGQSSNSNRGHTSFKSGATK